MLLATRCQLSSLQWSGAEVLDRLRDDVKRGEYHFA